jgi:hypothetical protein
MGTPTIRENVPPDKRDDSIQREILSELRGLRAEHRELRAYHRELCADVRRLVEIVDQFAGAFLNSKFRYGKPTDRWSRRRD